MKTAVIVVDMLHDFIRPDGVLYCGPQSEAIIEPIAHRLAQAHAQREPVIYLCDRHRTDDPEFEMFPSHAVAGTPGAEIIPELAPQPEDRVIPKRRFSAFIGTELLLALHELHVDALELTGVCTNICIQYTACNARDLGYPVTVHASCVATFDLEAHEYALKQMETVLGVTVVR
ncbi:MAG: cysteine hydrolase [Armatimonadetes bacterium]|nr:cysteine hydrolase [Armatimonadota bacterium]